MRNRCGNSERRHASGAGGGRATPAKSPLTSGTWASIGCWRLIVGPGGQRGQLVGQGHQPKPVPHHLQPSAPSAALAPLHAGRGSDAAAGDACLAARASAGQPSFDATLDPRNRPRPRPRRLGWHGSAHVALAWAIARTSGERCSARSQCVEQRPRLGVVSLVRTGRSQQWQYTRQRAAGTRLSARAQAASPFRWRAGSAEAPTLWSRRRRGIEYWPQRRHFTGAPSNDAVSSAWSAVALDISRHGQRLVSARRGSTGSARFCAGRVGGRVQIACSSASSVSA